jgi:hypothetical protein
VLRAAMGPVEQTVAKVFLRTPPVPCVVPPYVFDAFGWCASTVLEWRRPTTRWDDQAHLCGADPARMAFVMRTPCDFLPSELARLHAFGLGLDSELALAPWAIDDATDGLYAQGVSPNDCLWLAADNINALFWGLHDWAHFHNHGPFEHRAWTELQCDLAALAWLQANRRAADISDAVWQRVRSEAESTARARFAAEGLAFDATSMRVDRIAALSG